MAINLVNDNISTIEIQNKKYNIKSVPFHGTEAEWENNNYIPKDGEIIIYDIDENYDYKRIKIGNGVDNVSSLPFNEDAILDNVAFINESDNENVEVSEGGGTSIDVTAEVGQTIVVKEVDTNGKPTKWESADYQPRTHWSETGEFLPETTLEVDAETGFAVMDAIPFEVGIEYMVMYNGAEYRCVAFEAMGQVGIGNYDLITGTGDNGMPFVVAVVPGEATMFAPLDGSTTVTFSIIAEITNRIPKKYLPSNVAYNPDFDVVNVFDIQRFLTERGFDFENIVRPNRMVNTTVEIDMTEGQVEALYNAAAAGSHVVSGDCDYAYAFSSFENTVDDISVRIRTTGRTQLPRDMYRNLTCVVEIKWDKSTNTCTHEFLSSRIDYSAANSNSAGTELRLYSSNGKRYAIRVTDEGTLSVVG